MLKEILSISGHPGLYKLVTQTSNGIIVESLETKKRMPAYATHKISALEDIAIYTEDKEVGITDVFKNIFKYHEGKESISHKSSANELKAYFDKVLPNYDKDRVYVSDIKKIISWYNILHKTNAIDFTEKSKEEVNNEVNTEDND